MEVAAHKAANDNARCKRRVDCAHLFSGPLNKTKQKEELEDLAIALALPEGGKKDDLLKRICDHFEQHLNLKTNLHFEALFNSQPLKQACGADFSTAGSSTVHRFTSPYPMPPTFQHWAHSQTLLHL